MIDDRIYSENSDYAIVATGHFSTPNFPLVGGLAGFYGRVLHAHDFRDAREFSGQNNIIFGTRYCPRYWFSVLHLWRKISRGELSYLAYL